MKRQHLLWGAAGLALLMAGALAAGVPASTLVLLAVVLACPAMMLFMHGGHTGHGGQNAHDPLAGQNRHAGHREQPGHDHDGQTGARDDTGTVVDVTAGTTGAGRTHQHS